MRVVLLAVLLGACAARAPAGPAWPKLHESDDGGESLAPHVARSGPAATPASGTAAKQSSSDSNAAADDATEDDDSTASSADDSGSDGEIIIDVDGDP